MGLAAHPAKLTPMEFIVALVLSCLVLWGVSKANIQIQLFVDAGRWFSHLQESTKQVVVEANPRAEAEEGSASLRDENPFLTFSGDAGFRFHPLIGVVGAQFPKGATDFKKHWDYFGFRNDFNAYFDTGTYRYVVMTGNSELLGWKHNPTISQLLELKLNSRSHLKNYRVLNLANNSVTLPYEINYFVNLAFDLHPKFVISHSIANDLTYGPLVPSRFQSMGLNYLPVEVEWVKLIHAGNYDPKLLGLAIHGSSDLQLLSGLVKNVVRYKAIAEASGAQFIFGIQKFNRFAGRTDEARLEWTRAGRNYDQFKAMSENRQIDVNVIDFNNDALVSLDLGDPIHTTQASAEHIAELYAKQILSQE
jgi:hypothetical protein